MKSSARNRSVSEQVTFTAIASIVMYLIIAAISTYVITRLLRPLQTLSDALSELSQGEGDLTQRIEIERMDEIGELATHVNQFLAQMQSMLKNIVENSQQLSASASQNSASACVEGQSVIQKNREAIVSLAEQVSDAANVISELEANTQSINQILSTIQGYVYLANALMAQQKKSVP